MENEPETKSIVPLLHERQDVFQMVITRNWVLEIMAILKESQKALSSSEIADKLQTYFEDAPKRGMVQRLAYDMDSIRLVDTTRIQLEKRRGRLTHYYSLTGKGDLIVTDMATVFLNIISANQRIARTQTESVQTFIENGNATLQKWSRPDYPYSHDPRVGGTGSRF